MSVARYRRVNSAQERAALVSLVTKTSDRDAAEAHLHELEGLARAAGATVVLRTLQERDKADPATLLGSGKVETLALACDELEVDLVIVDHELSPAQQRNLERTLKVRVIDRTQLILDIFAMRARTREGQLQVELAQLRYLLPRLVGSSDALSRLGGGIGTRGPGETQLETDRRRVRQRIQRIGRDIAAVRRRRTQIRERRRRGGALPTVALVGYTNAGKTTLFNRLTREHAPASDALFVTLDPLVRQLRLPSGAGVLLADTVGFIDRLPHALVAAFRATLEEVSGADLLLVVIDASDPEWPRQLEAVRSVLGEVEALSVPSVLVFNKCDRLSPEDVKRLAESDADAVKISAETGEGVGQLLELMSTRLGLEASRIKLEFSDSDSSADVAIARLYRVGRVLKHQRGGGRVSIEADVPRKWLSRLATAGQGSNR